MSLINFKATEDVLAPEQKRELIEKLTDATASVYGDGIRSGHLGRHRRRWRMGDRRKARDHQ